MPITIDGTGSISGLSAGGLPDLSVTTADIAAGAVTAAKLDGAQSGSAPIYGARAWVNFNGTGTVAIRASGNVSSITDNAAGNYTINFTTALPDANYSAVGSVRSLDNMTDLSPSNRLIAFFSTYATSSVRFGAMQASNAALEDAVYCTAAIFR